MLKKDTEKETASAKPAKEIKNRRYIYAVGRRKTSTAQVRLFKNGRGEIIVNQKKYDEYFSCLEQKEKVIAPLKKVGLFEKCDLSILVKGGGTSGQADSICHGVARALVKLDEEFRKSLGSEGYLTRDPRRKERKKPGLKRARRAPQWSKR